MSVRAAIGLEIHAELNTATKMFCGSKNDPEESKPNVNVCPICMAHPGTLPAINRAAVSHVLRIGAALGGKLADYTEFDRKSYFYPDLPKGYQISQYEFPLVSGGSLQGVAITRVHLEEDTASSIHDEISGETLIDFNRAGVPLMELVTEPVLTNAKDASSFARELQLLLRYLGVSDANMEKGQMRVEGNVSVSGDEQLGTKVEIKNLNSFRTLERAVEYEIERQAKLLQSGGAVRQETRGWDEGKQATFAQREKEGSADYRYFPDPDLPSLRLSEIPGCGIEAVRQALPELPAARRSRYQRLGIQDEIASLFTRDANLGLFFEETISGIQDQEFIRLAANYVGNDLVKIIRDTEGRDAEMKVISLSPLNFRTLIRLLIENKISSRAAKDMLHEMAHSDQNPEELAQRRDLFQGKVADIEPVIRKLLAENDQAVAQYKSGKKTAIEFLVGQGMRVMRGAGNPALIREEITRQLQQ